MKACMKGDDEADAFLLLLSLQQLLLPMLPLRAGGSTGLTIIRLQLFHVCGSTVAAYFGEANIFTGSLACAPMEPL